ncbi:MAG TPA: hypothetical protein VFO38_05050 [Candidatus Saccharimonadales bacterium]|nr:hypothetical protein [Candidatus Saccharimonadales bacterium]
MNFLKHLFSPKMLVPAIALAIIGVAGFNIANQRPAVAADCSDNSVVRCGYTTPGDLAGKVNGEIQTIYNNAFTNGYGISNMSEFAANAKHATAYKDGRLVLDDGTLVATNSASLGRNSGGGNNHTIVINGKPYYWGYNNTAFGSNALSAYVLLNDDHSLKFAALTDCGNPLWGDSAGYKCQMLNKEKVNDTTYNFVATPATKNSTVTKIVYDFGDGNSQTVTSNFGQKVTHTYKPGKFTAKATVYFNVNGQEKSDTRAECTKPVEVPEPPKPVFVCDNLSYKQLTRTKYSFTVKGKSENATFVSAKFDFGDGQTAADLKGNNQTVTTEHEYKEDKEYTVKAYLTYKEGTTQEVKACTATIKINKETCADKPNAPECQPPKTCADTPNAPECQPPKTCENTPGMEGCYVLPSTGPAEIIGSALGLSSIAGAGMYYRNSRRNLLDVVLKR